MEIFIINSCSNDDKKILIINENMDLKTQMISSNQERKNENFELKNQIHSMITLVKKEQKCELSYLKSQINSINFSIVELKK